MRMFIFIAALSILLCGTSCFGASFPQALNYQGTLQTNTGQPVSGPQDITFSLYTAPVGADLPFWTETLSKVPVTIGQFSVTLGTVTPLDPSKFGGDTYLGVKVGTQAEMLPRQKMTSVPYAFNGIPKGGIIMWSGAEVPIGWALCNGNDGTPNLTDRFIVGTGNSYTIGNTGGENMHTLTINEMPTHNHELYIAQPGYAINRITSPGSYTMSDISSGYNYTKNTGGNQPHENRPPYYALAFIMKL